MRFLLLKPSRHKWRLWRNTRLSRTSNNFLIKFDMSLCLLISAFSFIKQLIVWWDYSKTNKVKLFLWWYFETGQNIFSVSFTGDSKIRYFSIKLHVFDSFIFPFFFFLYLFIIEFPCSFFSFSKKCLDNSLEFNRKIVLYRKPVFLLSKSCS